MLACLLEATNNVVVKDVPIPRLLDGDVLVRMEVSGAIARVADDIEDYAVGDRVIAHHHVPCYKCNLCRRGDLTLCAEFKKTNIDPCGFAEYFRVPRNNVEKGGLIKLPKDMSFDEGSLIEPTA